MSRQRTPDSLLRSALVANVAFSVISGTLMILGAGPLGRLLGFEEPFLLAAIGGGLLIFAAGVLHNARRESVNRLEALATIVGDLAWVAGSVLVIVAGPLSTTGNWLVAIVADVVLVFALLQTHGLYHLWRRQPA